MSNSGARNQERFNSMVYYAANYYADNLAQQLNEAGEQSAPHVFSPAYEKKMKKLLARKPRAPQRTWRHIAAAAVLLVVCGSVTVYAAERNIFSAVANWTQEKFFFITDQGSGSTTNEPLSDPLQIEKTHAGLQAALDDYGITARVAPNWYPEGYELFELEVWPSTDHNTFYASYLQGEQLLSVCILHHIQAPLSPMIYEKDDNSILVYEQNGIDHYIMSNNARLKAVYMNGDLECSISGSLSQDEMIKMIDSIY